MDTKEKRRTRRPAVKEQPTRRRVPAKKVPEPKREVPDVVYTPPKPFNRNRLLLRLATVAAVVIALVLGLSVFFKVGRIEISGMHKYSAWDIEQASGIKIGDNLFSFGEARASGKIINSLRYVKSVRIGIKLPDTVKIEVVEVEVTYALQDHSDKWWLISSEGRVIDQPASKPADATEIIGVRLQNPVLGENAVAFQQEQPTTDAEGNVIPVTVTAEERLLAALAIAVQLENNGIIGQAVNVDVTDLSDIRLQYNEKFQVKLGDRENMNYKIRCLKSAVNQFISSSGGVLDISNPDRIRFNGIEDE